MEEKQSNNLSSVKIIRAAKGRVDFEVKIYHEDPDIARELASQNFDILAAQYPAED